MIDMVKDEKIRLYFFKGFFNIDNVWAKAINHIERVVFKFFRPLKRSFITVPKFCERCFCTEVQHFLVCFSECSSDANNEISLSGSGACCNGEETGTFESSLEHGVEFGISSGLH